VLFHTFKRTLMWTIARVSRRREGAVPRLPSGPPRNPVWSDHVHAVEAVGAGEFFGKIFRRIGSDHTIIG